MLERGPGSAPQGAEEGVWDAGGDTSPSQGAKGRGEWAWRGALWPEGGWAGRATLLQQLWMEEGASLLVLLGAHAARGGPGGASSHSAAAGAHSLMEVRPNFHPELNNRPVA